MPENSAERDPMGQDWADIQNELRDDVAQVAVEDDDDTDDE